MHEFKQLYTLATIDGKLSFDFETSRPRLFKWGGVIWEHRKNIFLYKSMVIAAVYFSLL